MCRPLTGRLLAAMAFAVFGTMTPAWAERPRPVSFDGMDTNQDGYVSRSEWLVWFQDDLDRMSPSGSLHAPPSVEIRDSTGAVRRLVARPFSHDGQPADVDTAQNDDRITSPTAARQRLIRDQGRHHAFPDFDTFDTDGDNRISRAEMPFMPALGDSIPTVDSKRH